MSGDRDEIVAVLIRYARAIDTKDWTLLRTCFSDDVTVDYGTIGSWQGIDELAGFMVVAHAGMGPTQHMLSNFQIHIGGDRAESVSYVHAVTVLASHPDDWIDTVGVYSDRLERGSDGWKITDRTLQTTRTVLSPSLTRPTNLAKPEVTS